jgi:hypothetical protein
MPNSELWAGILVSHQWVIDSIVAEEHVGLQIGGDQVIEVDVEASDEYEEARITCRNLLFGTGGTKN